jgi:hypothetical protein
VSCYKALTGPICIIHIMQSEDWRKIEQRLRVVVVGLCVLFVLLFLYTALRRLLYPFEVDRMESGMMTTVWRLRHGYPLYSAPSLEWAPFLYAPLFFYVSAGVSKLVGVSYAALRLVSILATIGSFGVIATLVRLETRRWMTAIVAVGLFASLYAVVLGWFDVGRVDSLSIFFFLLALLATRRSHPLVAAVVWLLAFQTKQTFFPLALAVYLVEWRRPSRMATGMVAFAAMAVGSVMWFNHVTQHWYSYYVFGTAGALKWDPRVGAMFPFTDLLQPWPIVATLLVVAFILVPFRWRDRDGTFFAVVTVVLTGSMWFVRAHAGSNMNSILPLLAWVAVLTGVAIGRLLDRDEATGETAWPARGMVASLLWIAVIVQLGAHLYRPGQILREDLAAREQFEAELRATPGDVWLTDHSYDGILAGKPMHADMDALDAVLGRHYEPAVKEFNDAISGQRFTAIVLDRIPGGYKPDGLFTSAEFWHNYGAEALVPSTAGGTTPDQPHFLFLPCGAVQNAHSSGLQNTSSSFTDRSGCTQ